MQIQTNFEIIDTNISKRFNCLEITFDNQGTAACTINNTYTLAAGTRLVLGATFQDEINTTTFNFNFGSGTASIFAIYKTQKAN